MRTLLTVVTALAIGAVTTPASAQYFDIETHDRYYSHVRPQPHTMSRHVSVSYDAVEARVANGLRCASKFASLSQANYKINEWLADWESIVVDNLVEFGQDYERRSYTTKDHPHYGWTYIGPASGIASPGWYYANMFTIVIMKVPQSVKWDRYVVLTAYPNVQGWCYTGQTL